MPNVATIAEWSSIFGFIVSFIGILITLWVAREISKVRRAYVRRVRIPELLERFSELTSELSDHLNNYVASRHDVLKCISQLEEAAKSMSAKLAKKEKEAVLSLIDQIKNSDIPHINEAAARAIYLKAIAAHESVSSLNQDLVWQ